MEDRHSLIQIAEVSTRSPEQCQECDRTWVNTVERWRLYLTDDEVPRPVFYCPGCASREFDPD